MSCASYSAGRLAEESANALGSSLLRAYVLVMAVLCASDRSATSRSSLRAAVALAARLGERERLLVHVLGGGLSELLDTTQLENLKAGTLRTLLEHAQQARPGFDQVTIRPHVLVGP